MKLIEIPDTIMVLSEDDAGVIELSADLGAEHFRLEMERLEKEVQEKRINKALGEVQKHTRRTPERLPSRLNNSSDVDLKDLTWKSKFE